MIAETRILPGGQQTWGDPAVFLKTFFDRKRYPSKELPAAANIPLLNLLGNSGVQARKWMQRICGEFQKNPERCGNHRGIEVRRAKTR